ncbi:stage II sporulation protein M [Actinorhabdospora filicis]|uniref:stage II sporulation protein M n=1 Tax=Actinorhabdospora filicis TaxID=1785913 RepID=UPI0025556415|nr:stage II sporulation protein M [Actinorhabdospora filicis]
MDLDAYVAEHNAEWLRLDQLCRSGRLSADQSDELLMLYQRAATHLAVVRSRMPDPLLVARLSQLVLRARSTVTGTARTSPRQIVRFFTHTFPAAVYQAWPWCVGVLVVFVAATGIIITYIAGHPEAQLQLMSQGQIESLVNRDFKAYYSEYAAQNFFLKVWINNAFLSALALIGGVLIVPTLYALYTNLMNIGVTGGVMVGNGGGDTFFLYILPHGLLELTSIFVAAGVGLRIGWSWIAPAPGLTRGQSLARAARTGAMVAMGLVATLFVSGLVEGFVTPYLPSALAIPIGAAVWLGFIAYVVVRGRRAIAAGETGDLGSDVV